MKNLTAPFLMAAILLFAATMAASTIDVSNSTFVTFQTSDRLLVYIASGVSCGGPKSPNPSAIQILLGSMPLGGATAPIPGTSGVYLPGFLFSAALESQNGSVSIPFIDPDAARLGFPAGDMLLTPGWRTSNSYSGPIDVLSATVNLTPSESAAIFSSGEALIELHNIGTGVVAFGYPGASMAGDFTASLISSGGLQSQGARIVKVDEVHDVLCGVHPNVPEPGTMGLLILGLTILATRVVRHSAIR